MSEMSSVLIVDNDESLLNVLREGVELEGYSCKTTSNAESALKMIRETSFDIMVTDVVMTGMEGFELTVQAKKIRPNMNVIIMTGYIDDFSFDDALAAGAADFIKKPFTLIELVLRIKLVKMQEKIRLMAITDELTDLYNRRGFFVMAEQQLKLANRQRTGIYMLYADVDNLKQINDTLGHTAGDRVLIETATLLKDNYRDSDIIARIGGDEFVVIPVGTTKEGIDVISKRFKKTLDDHNKKTKSATPLSISIGIAYYDPEKPCSIDELLTKADRLMYEQKRKIRSANS